MPNRKPILMPLKIKEMMTNNPIRVSIAEDNERLRKILLRLITAASDMLFVSEYEYVEDALKGLPKDKPDVVIMDIDFNSTMTGVECMFRVKHKCPDIKFVMYTIFEDSGNLFDALKFGADGYIVKGQNVNEVIDAIRSVQEGGSPMSQSIAKKVVESFRVPKIEKLTLRQIEILELLATGKLYKEIAAELNPPITENGLKQNINKIYKKLQVNNRTEAINKYSATR